MIWFFLSCSPQDSISSWPKDPQALSEHCEQESNKDLQTLCRVQSAAIWTQSGETDKAAATCATINNANWKAECLFRIGEELGAKGELMQAIGYCAQSEPYDRHCLTHAIWRESLESNPMATPLKKLTQKELSGRLQAAKKHAQFGSESFKRALKDMLPAQITHNAIVGSGYADMKQTLHNPPLGDHFRTAIAIEATRLLKAGSKHNIESLMKAHSLGNTIVGERQTDLKGRWAKPIIGPHEDTVPRIQMFGGGSRIQGQDIEEDMLIALLHGSFFNLMPASTYIPLLSHTSNRVRWTAASLLTMTWVEQPEQLTKLQETKRHIDDPKVLWYFEKLLGAWSKNNKTFKSNFKFK